MNKLEMGIGVHAIVIRAERVRTDISSAWDTAAELRVGGRGGTD